jgi:hypothetical protein
VSAVQSAVQSAVPATILTTDQATIITTVFAADSKAVGAAHLATDGRANLPQFAAYKSTNQPPDATANIATQQTAHAPAIVAA